MIRSSSICLHGLSRKRTSASHRNAKDSIPSRDNYARTHARDLPVSQLIDLVNKHNKDVQKLALDLLQSRDPRQEIGLEAWGELLTTDNGHQIAAETLRKHFGANELTPEWFIPPLVSLNPQARQFAQDRLLTLHPRKNFGWHYFANVIEQLDGSEPGQNHACDFCCQQLEKLGTRRYPPRRGERDRAVCTVG